jgi:hypothetical protein
MTRVAFALLFGWAILATARAQNPSEAATQLAARISSQLPRRATVSLEMHNQTATAFDLSTFRGALEEELRKAGLLMTATQPDTRVRVTISENARGLLLVAEMLSGENRAVVMLPWTAPPEAESKPRVKILRRPVLEQAEPVLDLLLLNSGSELLVLSPAAVSSFHLTEGKWVLTGVAALSLARPPARDPRGRIETALEGMRVYLPGTTCTGTIQPALKFSCMPGNETWPAMRDLSLGARWMTDRNTLEFEGIQGTFYAAANGWFSTADHRIIDRAGNPLAAPEPLGSDLASVENACGSIPTVVASGAGTDPDRDQARAYEIADGHATPASEPLILPGPVTALWPAEAPGQATLVIRNSKTGNYEASRLGLACSE